MHIWRQVTQSNVESIELRKSLLNITVSLLLDLQFTIRPSIYQYTFNLPLHLQSTIIPSIYHWTFNLPLYLQFTIIPSIYHYTFNLPLDLQFTIIPSIYFNSIVKLYMNSSWLLRSWYMSVNRNWHRQVNNHQVPSWCIVYVHSVYFSHLEIVVVAI